METAVMVGSAVITGFLYYRLRKLDTNYHRYLDQIKDAPHLSIDQNLQSIVSEAPDNTIPYAVIEGSVEAIDKTLKSEHALGVMGVLEMLIRREHKMFLWRDTTRVISTIRHSVPFVIKDNNAGVKVDDPLSATGLEIPIIHDSFETSMSLLQFIVSYVIGKETKGFQTTEKMLSEGTVLTGIGKLSTSTGTLVLSPPSSADRPYILSDIGFSGISSKFQSNLKLKDFLFISASITVLLFARWLYNALYHGTFKCAKNNKCTVCKYIKESHFLYGTYFCRTIGRITCETSNVIYLITCRICEQQYVGETGRTLYERIKEHQYSVNAHLNDAVGRHFSDCDASIADDMIVQGIESLGPCTAKFRRSKEEGWIRYLNTLAHGINRRHAVGNRNK
ncbi:mitochondrial E3 ubiquitin protein ligase 1-like [Patiria miniata]|uniref:RING-type E3 ubiquitin transferase n=1 Tax=Patiria miniata TaxID=46514 RepID=A0A913ZR42_PATMI|nr:mitochondrial E3 ubiquitin protein ligase 1-like [Patiria miniata]